MAEDTSHSTKDLFLLMTGVYKLKAPLSLREATSAEKYWLEDKRTLREDEKRVLRESEWNPMWMLSPYFAWESVPYRDWLIANLMANLTSHKQDFSAISEPVFSSKDLLSKEFKPGMANASEAIKKIVVSKNGYERGFMTTLTVGLSKPQSRDREVIVVGAGMRRRTRVWRQGTDESHAVQADIEFFLPFYVVPQSGFLADLEFSWPAYLMYGSRPPRDTSFPGARSICAGLHLSRADGSFIGVDDKGKEIAGVRFNFRIPFTPPAGQSENGLVTRFDPPVIDVQKRNVVPHGADPAAWEKFAQAEPDDWKTFVETFCATDDGKELLNAPIGPLLLETVSDDSGIKDLILRKAKRDEIKKDVTEALKELDEAAELLKGLLKWKVPEESPEPDELLPGSGERQLGGLLESLGLLNRKGGGFTLAPLTGLTVWTVVNRLLDELDGFPLYIKGVDAKNDNGARGAITLASQADKIDSRKHYFGLAGLFYNIPIKTAAKDDPEAKAGDPDATTLVLDDGNFTDDESLLIHDDEDEQEEEETGGAAPPEEEEKPKKQSTLDLRLQLGKWFDGETLDDNWFRRLLPPLKLNEKSAWKRRVPLPGIRVLPFQREHKDDNTQATYSLAPHGDLLSLGVDFKGTTKDGLTFLKAQKGPLAYFGLGAVEARIALLFSGDRLAFGIGIKLKDLRLSFGPKEKDDKKEDEADDLIAGLQGLLADDWAVVPEPKKPKRELQTRLRAKKKDKFSISVGYLSPLTDGSHGTLDIQIYDEKGNRGKMAWIPIDRRSGTVYLKQIGIGLKGVENVELSKGLSDSAQLTIALTGGLRWPSFELGFIGARLSFPLKDPGKVEFGLDGLDLSLKMGSAIISGSFLKSGTEYAGSLTIDLPKFSIGAMGFYGNLAVFSMSYNEAVVEDLRRGKVHAKLLAELSKNEIKPVADRPIRRGYGDGQWVLRAEGGTPYVITDDDGKLNVLSPDKTLFIYGTLSAAGAGVKIGPIEFTGIALGFGLNRRIEVPAIEDVADFPLVKMVMGEGGYQEEDTSGDIRKQLGEAVKDPASVLAEMKDALPAERGQYFICAGVRFTIATSVDCFGLIIVQFGNDFEIALLGLARFRQPRDLSAKPICYVEMQLLMSIKPSEGTFKLQALLTSNSWIFNQDCKLTGGFAVYVWFGGKHKDDFVITLGGYHPRFRRPDHYPLVPRLGLNWPVNENLSIKGGVYLAVTPSCLMLGAKLEATFRSGRVSAWFTAYLDVIINWSPLHFEAELGISMRVEVAFALGNVDLAIVAKVELWGPPIGMLAHVKLTVLSIDIPFTIQVGASRDAAKPKLIESWSQFCQSFLKISEADKKAIDTPLKDKPLAVASITQPNLAAGRNNPSWRPGARQEPTPRREDAVWKVRGDELELAAAAAVPVTTLNLGRVKPDSSPAGIPERSSTGKSLLLPKPIGLETAGLKTKQFAGALGVHPMGKTLQSVLSVTIVRDELAQTQPVDLADWTMEAEINSLPAALWDAARPEPRGPGEPSAKLIPDCITGIKRLKPPPGERGPEASLSIKEWSKLTSRPVPKSAVVQEIPSATRDRSVQAAMAGKQTAQKQVVEALAAVGFNLTWQPAQAEIHFRELQAEPMAGAVATSV